MPRTLNGIIVGGADLVIPDHEEEFIEGTIGLPVNGYDGVTGPQTCLLSPFEDLGDDVGSGFVHGSPAEIDVVLPANHVGQIKTV
jgi:hypothetical protein